MTIRPKPFLSNIVVLSLLLITGVYAPLIVKLSDNKAFIFTKFMNDCYPRKLAVHYENITFKPGNGMFSFDYDLVVDRVIHQRMLYFKFKKCPSADNLDACVSYPTWKASNICRFLFTSNNVWTPIFACAKPQMECPYRKGVYRGRNCSVDMQAFRFFPLTSGYWHLEAEVLDDKKNVVLCVSCQGNAIRI